MKVACQHLKFLIQTSGFSLCYLAHTKTSAYGRTDTKKIPQLNEKLRDYYLQKSLEQAGKRRTYKNEARVLPLMRQEIDVEKLAQALIMMAKDMATKSESAK